jgi:two-component system sensor kinase FixL
MERNRHALLAAILQTAVDAIIVIDARGRVLELNPAVERMFGYTANEVLGQNVSMLMPPPFRDQHDGYLENYQTTGHAKIIGIGREIVAQRKDGSLFPIHLAVSEVEHGPQPLYAGILRDITDLKDTQQKLADLNAELEQRVRQRTSELRLAQAELVRQERLATLGQVSGGIAHEIRNPLNAIKTSAYYLLHANNPSQEKVRQHLERIDRQVTMIDNVVTALYDVARLPEPHLDQVDLQQLVAAVVGRITMNPAITVLNELPSDLPMARADANQIPIVFRNLIRNARDAMTAGGTLTLSATLLPDQIAIHVRDTGVGIAERDLDRIAEPLFSTKARGMGLGLAISKTILEKNGGRLQIESQLGQGSTFTVYLSTITDAKRSEVQGSPV